MANAEADRIHGRPFSIYLHKNKIAMKISSKIFVSALCVSMLIVSSCDTTGSKKGARSYDLSSFDAVDLSAIEPERVSPPEMILGMPFEICMVSDSILAFKDIRIGNRQLWLLNVNNGKSAQTLYYGNGPKECLGVSNIWKDNGYLFAGGFYDRKVLKIGINPDSLTSDIECIAEIPDDFLRVITLSDSCLLYAPISIPDVRYLLARMDGSVIDTVGIFNLKDRVEEGLRPANHMFQMQMAFSPDKRYMVAPNIDWPMIEIYTTVSFNETIVLEGPVKTDSRIIERVSASGMIGYPQKPGWSMFRGLTSCNDGFVVGFVGRELKNIEDYNKGPESLLLFDWEGNPTKKIDFGREIVDFTIDFKSMTLYALVNDPEPMVVKYALPVGYDELWES